MKMLQIFSISAFILSMLLFSCSEDIHDSLESENQSDLDYEIFLNDQSIIYNLKSLKNNPDKDKVIEKIKKDIEIADIQQGFLTRWLKKNEDFDWDNIYLNPIDTGLGEFILPIGNPNSKKTKAIVFLIHKEDRLALKLIRRNTLIKYTSKKFEESRWPNLLATVVAMLHFDKTLYDFEDKKLLEWFKEVSKVNLRNVRSKGAVTFCFPDQQYAFRSDGEEVKNKSFIYVSYQTGDTFEGDDPNQGSSVCYTGNCGGGSIYWNNNGGGGSSGGGSGAGTEMLPDYDGMPNTEKVSNMHALYVLDNEQVQYLLDNPALTTLIYDTHNSQLTESLRAQLLYNNLSIDIVDLLLFSQEIAMLKHKHPNWSEWHYVVHAYLNIKLNKTHDFLDIVGFIPGFGEVFDFANAGIYLLEGNGKDAVISLAGTIPFLGWTATGSRMAMKTVNKVGGGKLTLWLKNDNGIIKFTDKFGSDFRSRNQLRKNMGIPTGSSSQAHHLIPWEHKGNALVQRAAESGKFHMNAKGNGFDLDLARHQDSHTSYNILLNNHMTTFFNTNSNISVDNAFQEILSIQNSVRSQLLSGKTLSQITLP